MPQFPNGSWGVVEACFPMLYAHRNTKFSPYPPPPHLLWIFVKPVRESLCVREGGIFAGHYGIGISTPPPPQLSLSYGTSPTCMAPSYVRLLHTILAAVNFGDWFQRISQRCWTWHCDWGEPKWAPHLHVSLIWEITVPVHIICMYILICHFRVHRAVYMHVHIMNMVQIVNMHHTPHT